MIRAQDRNALISRGLAITELLHPTTLTFDGFDPLPATRRASAMTAGLRLGGSTPDAPRVFLIRKEVMPAELLARLEVATENPKRFVFLDGAETVRLDTIDNEPNEPHVRLNCNLARR